MEDLNKSSIKKVTLDKSNGIEHPHKWVHNIDHIQRIIDGSDCTHKELSDTFGVSQSEISRWIRDSKCPRWTLLAAEGITRRKRSENTETIFICSPKTKESKEALVIFTKALGIGIVKVNLSNMN